jgi:hypothetical protein
MAARKTKLFIYTNGVVTDIIYSPTLFTTIDELDVFLQSKGYTFSLSELQEVFNSQLNEDTVCCVELTPITPELNITFGSFTSALVEIVNFTTQEDRNTYLLEVLLNNVVVQTQIVIGQTTLIENLLQGTIYTFRVTSQTCSNNVIVEILRQTPPILLTVTVIGEGTSPQALNNSQIHMLTSGDDFYIEFEGGVVNTNELWYYKSVTRDSINIGNLVTFTETINSVNTDGNLIITNVIQNTEVVITFTTRTAQWCTDTSCIVCDELLEQATLNTLYVYENGQQIIGSPFTITTGADPQIIAETYFISTELATELIANQITSSVGICCFDTLPVISNLQITAVGETSLSYSFLSVPVLPSYTAQIRRLPVNQLIQQLTLNAMTGVFSNLQTDVEYEIRVNGSNCAGNNLAVITGVPISICTDPLLVISSVTAIPSITQVDISIISTGVQFNIFVYEHETDSNSPIIGLVNQFITTDLTFTIINLTPLTTYRIEVSTNNCAGVVTNFVVTTTLIACIDVDPGDMIDPIIIP